MTSGAKPRVLCIDRDSVSLSLRSAIVETGGFEAIARTSIEAARQLVREQKVDIVVLDENAVDNDNGALSQATKLFPAVPILFLSSVAPYPTSNGSDSILRRFHKQDGPAAFVAALQECAGDGEGRTHAQDGYHSPA